MTTYFTKNPLGSSSPYDLFDNAQNFDAAVNSITAAIWQDRFGKDRLSWYGIESLATQSMLNYGYITAKSFEQGYTLLTPNTVLQLESDGEYYRWDGDWSQPKVVPPGSTPDTAGGVGPGKWVGVGDASLRSDLARPDGSKLLWAAPGRTQADKNKDIISVLDKGADPSGAKDSTAAFLAAGDWALVPPGLYLVDPTQVSLKNCWGPGKLKYRTDGSEHWCGLASKGTLYIRNGDRNGDGTPTVPFDGLINLADGELKFLCDLDADGDLDADIYGQNNLYIAGENSIHLRVDPQGPAEGRIRIASTANTNFIQSGKDYTGATLKNLAFGPYLSTDYWMFLSQSSGYMVLGNSASPAAPLHVYNSQPTPAVFENTSSSRSRVAFKGSTSTTGTSVTVGANGNDFEVRAGGAEKLIVTADGFVRPATANAQYCGSNPFPWAGGYTQTAFTITSDADCKSDPLLMTDSMLDAWGEVGWVQYKYLDRIEAKGEDGARWHFGLIAQRAKEAFERHGLDAHRFGFLCYDEWDDVHESVQTNTGETVLATREVTRPATKEIETWQDTFISDEAGDRVVRERVKKTIPLTRQVPVVDERGNQLMAADGSPLFSRVDVMETVKVKEEVPAEPVYEQVLVRPAGKRYGIRYEEAFAIEAAYQRRNFIRLQERVEALENQ